MTRAFDAIDSPGCATCLISEAGCTPSPEEKGFAGNIALRSAAAAAGDSEGYTALADPFKQSSAAFHGELIASDSVGHMHNAQNRGRMIGEDRCMIWRYDNESHKIVPRSRSVDQALLEDDE